jgi:hypothetical protein
MTIIIGMTYVILLISLLLSPGISIPITTVWALNITGTQGPDILYGTPADDNIRGHGAGDRYLVLKVRTK